jgi:eukaryotic-like serine/threonine-protein kinase
MLEVRTCSECGSPIPGNASDGYCPKCLLALANTAAAAENTGLSPFALGPRNVAGLSFGNYELLELIGEGGMGVVYKAWQGALNRTVAVKMLRSGSLAGDSEVKRFRSEARAAAKLQHPNVVAIHEVGEHEGRLYFTMDYIQGPNLAEVVHGAPLSAERAARYVKTIAEAVHYAHQQGILHRDLKPANILLDSNDQPRITDFGLAKQVESDAALTLSGAVLGTPSYMPPEQATGRGKEIGPACDVYSLGAIIYDLLTGRPPFRADTPLDTLLQVVEAAPAPPRLLNPKVPRDLETICLKCLAKDPGQRYQTAQALAEDLGRALKHEPIRARPIGRLGRLRRWCYRNPVIAGLSGSTVLLLLVMTVAAWLFRMDAIGGNVHAAQLVARIVANRLLELGEDVRKVADNPELSRALLEAQGQSPAGAALTNFLRQTHQEFRTNALGVLQFENWMVLGTNGHMLARWPVEKKKYDLVGRDYFQGALRYARDKVPGAYVSKVYQSLMDRLHKFGVSKVIRDENGTVLGVLAGMVGTDSTSGALGLTLKERQVVIVGAFDTNWTSGDLSVATNQLSRPWAVPDYVILLHPAFHAQSAAVPIEHRHLGALMAELPGSIQTGQDIQTRQDPRYKDPVAKQYRLSQGPWLAGFARVPGVPFIVIYQTRDWIANSLLVAAGFATVATFAALIFLYIRRRVSIRRSLVG